MAPETETYCARCGTSLAPGAYFCLRCGTSVPLTTGGAGATVAPPVRRPLPAQHNAQLDAPAKPTPAGSGVSARRGRGGWPPGSSPTNAAPTPTVSSKGRGPAPPPSGGGWRAGRTTYQRPEQRAPLDVSRASVQSRLGVVAHEMLAGRLPFLGESSMAVMSAHFNERPGPVAEVRPRCPPNPSAGVMRM